MRSSCDTYGICPNNIRIDDTQAKGYVEKGFPETFRRYISQSDLDALTAEVEQRGPPPSAGPDSEVGH